MTIHVLHVIDSLKPGGAERQLVNLARAFDPERIRSSVITLFAELDLAGPIREAGISVVSLGLTGPRQWARGVHRLRRYIADLRPDLVHTRLVYADLVGRLAAMLSGRPVLSSVEAPIYAPEAVADDPDHRRWKLQAIRLADGLTGRLARAVYVPCGDAVARSTARALLLPPERIRVIHNSTVVPNGSTRSSRAVPLGAKDEVELLTVGRLSPQKGQTYLLRALVGVVARYPRTRLSIIGRGPLESALRAEARGLGIDRHVEFLGKRPDVPELLGRAHLFVLPSLWEGLSIVALEALAAGVPMVATDIPSMREVAEGDVHALLVPPRDPAALAEAMVRMLGDPELRGRLSTAARDQARRRFDVREAARRYEALYGELAPHGQTAEAARRVP